MLRSMWGLTLLAPLMPSLGVFRPVVALCQVPQLPVFLCGVT